MRVITGTAKGRRLQTPPGLETRPTTEVAKEAVFSMIQFEVEGAEVLDLFAGCGQMGIEALSRGAKSCVFVDSAKTCQQVQRQNLSHTGLARRARVVAGDAASYLKTAAGLFDIVFMDPPYGQGIAAAALPLAAEVTRENGVILCEHERGDDLPEQAGKFVRQKQYRYGKTMVSLYRVPQTEE